MTGVSPLPAFIRWLHVHPMNVGRHPYASTMADLSDQLLVILSDTAATPSGMNQNYSSRKGANYSPVSSANSTNQKDVDLAKAEVVVLSVILALAVFGNVCVLTALGRKQKIRSRMHMFILHLSIADLLVALFNVLPQMIWEILGEFQGGDLLCRFVKYMQIFVMYLSTYILVMTGVDRYIAICHPLSNHIWTMRTVNLVAAMVYLVSGMLSIPQALLFKYQEKSPGSKNYDCWVLWDPPWLLQLYITSFTFAIYVIPFVVLVYAYGAICYTIWRKHRNLKASFLRKHVTNGLAYTGNYGSTPRGGSSQRNGIYYPRMHSRRGFSSAKLKTVKLTFVVIIAYLICWSPFFVSQLWWLYDETLPYSNKAVSIMVLMASLNSCCNPWIYLAFSGNLFRYLSPCYNSQCITSRAESNGHSEPTIKLNSTIELDHLETKRTRSLTLFLTSKMSRKDVIALTPKIVKSKSSQSDDSDCPKSPHVTKRARVHERPPEEVEKAQKTWDRNMGIETSVDGHCFKRESPTSDDDSLVAVDSYV
ncbi:cephalotocin receptor 2-like [Gigantopelta aegis]|uniref:cephalotocin receptor 2-like n=1 Tax=Gigantopelta aegis TaxID=1735272 RepID=UPI001B88E3AC|nr:cephalotocin receptor 2-like [Gigantopelta aegis]